MPSDPASALRLWVTARDHPERLRPCPAIALAPLSDARSRTSTIWADDLVLYQEIEGFGGAFTEAAAVTLKKMPP